MSRLYAPSHLLNGWAEHKNNLAGFDPNKSSVYEIFETKDPSTVKIYAEHDNIKAARTAAGVLGDVKIITEIGKEYWR